MYMGLITEKSYIVMQWRGNFDSVDTASSTFANRVIFRQKTRLIYHDINNCSRSAHAYSQYYFRLFLKHYNIREGWSMEIAVRDGNCQIFSLKFSMYLLL
jgi:hypothetical protein